MHCAVWIKRPLTFYLVGAMVFSVSASGCASTREVDAEYPDESYREIQEDLTGKEVRITRGDGGYYEGHNLELNSNSATWEDVRTGEMTNLATSDIWHLQTTSHSQGAGQGFLFGVLILGGIGAMLGVAGTTEGNDSVLAGTLIGGAIGGFLGLIIGSAKGATTTYEITPELVPTSEEQ